MIGQVVYNIRDYNSSGGYVSTSKANPYATISSNTPNYEGLRVNIFDTDLVKLYTSGGFLKIGIQAPPGTQVILNGSKTIMVGRTGVYELDEDINITSMRFIRPYKYILDEAATALALAAGKEGFADAENNRAIALAALDAAHGDDKGNVYWSEYAKIQDAYQIAYSKAYSNYLMGINGIYVLPSPDNPTSDDNYEELFNIIVDFRY